VSHSLRQFTGLSFKEKMIALGALVIIMLAIGSKVRGMDSTMFNKNTNFIVTQ
jgi:hypothetical protein